MVFAIHWHESAMDLHMFPILNPPSHLPPHPIPLGHPSAPALSTCHADNFLKAHINYMEIAASWRTAEQPRIIVLFSSLVGRLNVFTRYFFTSQISLLRSVSSPFPKTLNEQTWRLLSKCIRWCFHSKLFSGMWTWGCLALALNRARQQRAGLRLSFVSVQVICCCHSIRKLTKNSCKAVLPRPAQGAWAPRWGLPVTPAPRKVGAGHILRCWFLLPV